MFEVFTRIPGDRYLLDSGRHYRLWFWLPSLCIGVENLIQWHGIGRHGLLGKAIEELAATLRASPVEAKREFIVDLIVVGTHGRCGMAGVLFGSIAQLISRYCSCPVLTVGPHSPGPWLDNPDDSGRPLLFASAFNKASAEAAPYAISLANDFERRLFALHVMPLRKDCIAHTDHRALALAHLNALIPSDAARRCEATLLVEYCDPPKASSARQNAFRP